MISEPSLRVLDAADQIDAKGIAAPELLRRAINLALARNLTWTETVDLVDELERRSGLALHQPASRLPAR